MIGGKKRENLKEKEKGEWDTSVQNDKGVFNNLSSNTIIFLDYFSLEILFGVIFAIFP